MKFIWIAIALIGAFAACRSRPNADPHAGHERASAASPFPTGYAPVTISAERISPLQLTTVPVEISNFTKTVRTVGVVTLDETRSAHVHAKIRGWIDGIQGSFVGQKVRAGDPLCAIYSQDVYAAKIEFLSILERAASPALGHGEFADSERRAQQQLLEAARRRLSLWDVPREEIARLERTREPQRTFPLLSPRAGVIVAKQAVDGMYVEPSLELYTLSDLSRVWVLVDVYEADVPYIRLGDVAQLSIEGQEAPAQAKVAFIAPTIDEATRTLKVRFELANSGNRLRPGAFVSAEIENVDLGQGLAVPASAVIRTGPRSIVFVAHGEHAEHLVPREVKLGPLAGDRYRVDGGLEAGERVAVGAQFLLDSESRLQATSAPGAGHAH